MYDKFINFYENDLFYIKYVILLIENL